MRNELDESQGHYASEKKKQAQKVTYGMILFAYQSRNDKQGMVDTGTLGLLLLEHLLLELIHDTGKPGPHRAAEWRITETRWSAAPAELSANSQHHLPS